MIIAPDEGKIPWWRLLWSLLGAVGISLVGLVALMTDMNNPGPLHIAVELITLPFVRPVYYLLGLKSNAAIAIAAIASLVLWWFIIAVVLVRKMRNQRSARPA